MRRPPSAPASTPRPAAACWRSPRWHGGGAFAARSTSGRAPGFSRSPPPSGCTGGCGPATSIPSPPPSLATMPRRTASPASCACALRRRRYDLVLSNILARPLALLAPELARVLAPDGRAVLSGLLARQEALVLAAHRRCGLALERRYRIEGWSTLVLRRRSRTELARMREPPILQGR